MSWFFIAICGPILWSFVNHIDKFLIDKYFKRNGVGTLLIFSSLIGLITLPFLFIVNPSIFNVSGLHILILIAGGIANGIALWLYFIALEEDETSIVVIFYQLIPIFAYILGYFILGEVLTIKQIVAMAIVIAGAAIVSFEIDEENNFTARKKTVVLMVIASLIYALSSVVFKYVAIEENLWRSLFWEYFGLGFVGIVFFIFIKKYRKDFLQMVKNNSSAIFSLNIFNEAIYIIGSILTAYAYLLAPIALVLLVNSYQPIFVFSIGIILTVFFPKIVVEKIKIQHLIQKILAIVVMGIGTYLLFS